MTKEMIISAYCKIRTIDNTIPDDVLDFMKESALEALTRQTGTNKLVSGSEPSYKESISPDWKGDPDDPARWNGW